MQSEPKLLVYDSNEIRTYEKYPVRGFSIKHGNTNAYWFG